MTDNPNCPFCGRLPEKAAKRNAIIGTHPGLACRTEGCIAKDIWFDDDYRYAIRPAEDALTAYADKLAAGLPEGMLPKDVEVLREANAKLAQEVHELREANRWIPCAERLPDISRDGITSNWVLLPIDGALGYYDFEYSTWVNAQGDDDTAITHWRPLPEPPAGPEVEG